MGHVLQRQTGSLRPSGADGSPGKGNLLEVELLGFYKGVNHPAASSGAWKLKRPKGRGIDPRGIRQIPMQAWLFSSLLAGIKERYDHD